MSVSILAWKILKMLPTKNRRPRPKRGVGGPDDHDLVQTLCRTLCRPCANLGKSFRGEVTAAIFHFTTTLKLKTKQRQKTCQHASPYNTSVCANTLDWWCCADSLRLATIPCQSPPNTYPWSEGSTPDSSWPHHASSLVFCGRSVDTHRKDRFSFSTVGTRHNISCNGHTKTVPAYGSKAPDGHGRSFACLR